MEILETVLSLQNAICTTWRRPQQPSASPTFPHKNFRLTFCMKGSHLVLAVKLLFVIINIMPMAAGAPRNFDIDRHCTISSTWQDNRGIAPHNITEYQCRNVSPSTFRVAKCRKRCIDPLRPALYSFSQQDYMQEKVHVVMYFQIRRASQQIMQSKNVTITCRCVARPHTAT